MGCGSKMKSIPGFEGHYSIDENGAVFGHRHKRFIKPIRHWSGHLEVKLWSVEKNGHVHRRVHRLVLEAFGRPPEAGEVCRHLDGNPTNNHISNLAWGSRLENAQDMIQHGRSQKGRNWQRLSQESKGAIAEALQSGRQTRQQIADRFGVHRMTIQRMARKGQSDF